MRGELLIGSLVAGAIAGCNTGSAPGSTSAATASSVPPAPPVSSSRSSVASTVAHEHLTLVKAESGTTLPSDRAPLLTVSRTDLLLGDQSIAKVSPGPLGFAPAQKRDGNAAALQITPLDDALKALRQSDPTLDTARIQLDAATPYRTTLEVFFTAAHAGFTGYDFLVSSPAGERALHISTPTRAQRKEARAGNAPPSLALVVQPDAFNLSIGSDAIGAGCIKDTTGSAVVRHGTPADLDALVACTQRIRTMAPDWAGLATVQLSAAPSVDAQAVLSVVAAMLPTFPQVYFGLLQ